MSKVIYLTSYHEALKKVEARLPAGDGGATSDGMGPIWAKLEEHDQALKRIESDLSGLKSSVSLLPSQMQLFWGAVVFVVTIAGLVYGVGSYMGSTMSTALSAIQTVIAERPPAAASAPSQPTVIVVPSPQPIITAPTAK